ncbi:MAG: HlyD family efflux transporter periplasmic adaptor subunit [Gammaproteobacteria bacterium]|nr:HlyD family efflux transporter periplasmic adaptor subunit [Gammaproteobacteria bacterium]
MRRIALASALLIGSSALGADRAISSLGRIEPQDGVFQLAGPSEISVVAELRVREGDMVERGDVLATLDTHQVQSTQVKRAEVDLDYARRVLERNETLKKGAFQSVAQLDEAQRDVHLREAELAAARASLAQTMVRAPVAGQVLLIHAREGERIGPDGLLELGQTQRMYVVAEVYETDIGLVRVGQVATATSPALATPITGKVERIGRLVGKVDVLDLDPVARTDARVVEVFILLDEPTQVAALTNLQVSVQIAN